MRVSDSLVHRFVTNSNIRAKAQYYQAAEDTVLLRKVGTPADDLGAAQRILRIDRSLADLDAMSRTRDMVRSDMTNVESTLNAVSDTLIQVKELAIQMSNDTMNADDRLAGAENVQGLRETMLDLLNTQFSDGRYALSGLRDSTPPYTAEGAYQGSTSNRQVEVAPNTFIQTTMTGPDVFGTEDPFLMLDQLQFSLEANTVGGIIASIDQLDALIAASAQAQTKSGLALNRLDSAEDIASELQLQFQIERSQLQDLDLAEAVSNFEATEQGLNAVISVTQRLMQMTIRPYLR